MSTRGNYVFISVPLVVDNNLNYVLDETGSFVLDVNELQQLEESIDDSLLSIKRGQKIYVHSDNYPSNAVPSLLEFLNTDGAKSRANQHSYLGAWFVTFKCLKMLPFTRAISDRDFNREECVNPSYDDLINSKDLYGVGLETSLTGGADYTYLVCPELKSLDSSETTGKLVIYVYDWNLNFIDKFTSDIDVAELEVKGWYH